MTAVELFTTLTAAGCRLLPDGERLRVQDPQQALTEALRRAIRQRKQELLSLLTQPQPSGPDDHFPVSVLVCPLCQQAAFRYPSGRIECQHPACGTPVLERPTFVCGHCGGTRAYYPGKAGSPWGPGYCAACGQRHES